MTWWIFPLLLPTLFDVLPPRSCDDARHLPATDSIFGPYSSLCLAACDTLSDIHNVLLRQFGLWEVRSSRRNSAATLVHVGHVLSGSSDVQMGLVDARSNVALVKNEHARRNRPVHQLPRDTVCRPDFPSMPNHTVTAACFPAAPKNAAGARVGPQRVIKTLLQRGKPELTPVYRAVVIPTHDKVIA